MCLYFWLLPSSTSAAITRFICVIMYNILKPELIWIEGRCYRSNDSHTDVTNFQEHNLYDEEIPFQDEVDDDDEVEVYMMDNNRYGTNLHVSKHYLGAIIGKKGAVKMRIERDTKTDIKIPRQGENKDIVIYGPSASNVKAARRKINMIVMSSRMKQSPTHFISIPINQPDIVNNFETFKHEVVQDCKDIDESLFIRATKLHVTVGVLCLMDNEERMLASDLFTEAKETVIMPLIREYLPLRVRVRGLSYMNDEPRATHVLYARVYDECAPSGTLQRLVDAIVEHFYKAGVMDRQFDRDNVKMHVTLMNSKYRAKSQEESDDSRQKIKPFDVSEILAKYSDYDFGVAEINDIHLSIRRSMGADGYYQPTCVLSCNK